MFIVIYMKSLFFHKNIIYNITLVYYFFSKCNDKTYEANGTFTILENNSIKNKSIVYDEEFCQNYQEILDINNFKNITKLFLLSKK